MAAHTRIAVATAAKQMRLFSTGAASYSKELVKPPLHLYGIRGRYAHALFSAASKQKSLDSVESDLLKLQGTLHADHKFASYVMDPSVNKRGKQGVLEAVLQKQKCDPLTINLFAALTENSRLKDIHSIINAFKELMSSHRGEVNCLITAAKELDAASIKELTTALQGLLKKNEKLNVTTKVDSNLIGGVVVNIGEYYVDMSIASKVKKYSNSIRAEL